MLMGMSAVPADLQLVARFISQNVHSRGRMTGGILPPVSHAHERNGSFTKPEQLALVSLPRQGTAG